MESRKASRQTRRFTAVICFLVVAGFLLPAEPAGAAERQFLVILANSPKQYPNDEERDPDGQPLGGLANNPQFNPQVIRHQYFDKIDPDVGSFAEYWEEISYGDVTISGDVTGWINLPWPIQPPLIDPEDDDPEEPPVDDPDVARHSPAMFYDLNPDLWYRYGQGERITPYAAVIIDTDGDPNRIDNGPDQPGPGSGHVTVRGAAVRKPGERFVDMDEDNKWDGLDEANNMMDWDGNGQPDVRGPWIDLNQDGEAGGSTGCIYLSDSDNDGNPDCCPNGPWDPDETRNERNSGCARFGYPQFSSDPGYLKVCPATRWDAPFGEFSDCNGNLIPDVCDIDPVENPQAAADCAALIAAGYTGPQPPLSPMSQRSHDRSPQGRDEAGRPVPAPDGIPDECQYVNYAGSGCYADIADGGAPCIPLEVPRDTTERCEYHDSNYDGNMDIVEPFENFMRRWDSCIQDPERSPQNYFNLQTHWIKVYDPSSPFAGTTLTCSNPPHTVDYGDDSYIQHNYPANPSGVAELIEESSGRLLIGSHDPYEKLPPADCRCPDGSSCLDPIPDLPEGYVEPVRSCVIGLHIQYDPPDGWDNVIFGDDDWERTPDGEPVYTTKMQSAPHIGGTAPEGGGQFVPNVVTPEPPWYQQAWEDRYKLSFPAPPWPSGGEIVAIETFADVNAETYEPTANRRFFKANAGGTTGRGVGWVGCADQYDPRIIFETGDAGVVGFERLCNHPILPEEADGEGDAPIFYDGWVEHDDLPSSKYHRAGDQWLGEVTSPFNFIIYGQNIGPYEPGDDPGSTGDIPRPDGKIIAAGPYATDIHGNFYFDAGNLLTMELLTWCTQPGCINSGVAWEHDLDFEFPCLLRSRSHPYAGPSGANLGFRDYNLDGLLDLGETRFAGSRTNWSPASEGYIPSPENYLVDSYPHRGDHGIDSVYPFNSLRLIEDCIEVLDRLIDFDDFVDTVALEAHTCPSNYPMPNAEVPAPQQGLGWNDTIVPDGINSGIVLLPPDCYHHDGEYFASKDFLIRVRTFYPVHNEDGDATDDSISFPRDHPGAHERIVWNLFAHNLVRQLVLPEEEESQAYDYEAAYAAKEYLKTWENFPDLYDYDIYSDLPGTVFNTPIGQFDIMAHIMDRPPLHLIHSVPILKEKPCTEWIKPVDLATVLTPGIDATITIPSYESVRESAYFLENDDRLGERYYFWSAGLQDSFDEPGFPGFGDPDLITGGLPGTGMLIMHVDVGSNPDALPPGQLHPTRFNYVIEQGDGRGELDAGIAPYGDAGDFWPGSANATEFNFETNPPATWYTQNSLTGISVLDVREDDYGAVQLRIVWVPTSIPSLYFVDPPGGTAINSVYGVNFDATDVYGGTTIEVYYTQDPTDISLTNFIDSVDKITPGTRRLSVDWSIANVPDGRYYLFAKLIPGSGADGDELEYTTPRAGRNNVGDGTMTVINVDIAGNKARSESWTATCISPQGNEWVVYSLLSQPVPGTEDPNQDPWRHAFTNQTYTSEHGGVRFIITQTGPTPFAVGDTFTFTTTGITAVSRAVTVAAGQIKENPTAVILATPLAGYPSLEVEFDGSRSVDPEGQPLRYEWDFGDGSSPATGEQVQHTYTQHGTFSARLRVTNPLNGRFGEASVDIEVINNSPKARISADPTSGPAPLMVDFDASRSSDAVNETKPEDLIYQWDFGDGGTANNAGMPGILINTQHLYERDANGVLCTAENPCTFWPTLTITDEGEKQDTATVQIYVGNTAPVVHITPTALRGTAPHEVKFDASSSTDAEGHEMKVDWVWGDGTKDDAVPIGGPVGDGIVVHTYHLPTGETRYSYRTTATVYDIVNGARGASTEWPGVTVIVSEKLADPSDPFASEFTIDPLPPILNEPFTVDGSGSYDLPDEGPVARFEWDWGDNTAFGSRSVETHTYTEPGSYTITLRVYDDEDPANVDSRRRTVQVDAGPIGPPPTTNRRPDAVINVNRTEGVAGVTEFVFDGRGSTDLDDDTLTYSWNFGGGTRSTGPVVARVFPDSGQYTVTLTVTDTSYVSDDATVTITVLPSEGNRPPFAFIGTGPRTGAAPLTLTFNGQNSYDPDGDPITFTWELLRDAALIASPTGPTTTYVFSEEGDYSVILEVSDGRGGMTRTDAEIVTVTARVEEPEPPAPVRPDEDGEIGDSADQRPARYCGLGMLMSFFGSLVGLSAVRLSRRRLRL